MEKIAIIGSTELAYQLIYYFENTGFGTVAGMFDDFESEGTIKLFSRKNITKSLKRADTSICCNDW